MSLGDLHLEILHYIFNSFLDTNSLLKSRVVCKKWNTLICSDMIERWKIIYEEMVSIMAPDKTVALRHKGGKIGALCPNINTTCTIPMHQVYLRKKQIPAEKKIYSQFFDAIVRENQNPLYLYRLLESEKKKITLASSKIFSSSYQRRMAIRRRNIKKKGKKTTDHNGMCEIFSDNKRISMELANKMKKLKEAHASRESEAFKTRSEYLFQKVNGITREKISEPLPKSPKHD